MTACEVVLREVPVPLFWQLQRHQEEMVREFALIDIDRARGGAGAVPARLLEIVTELHGQYAQQRGVLLDELEAAADRGDETVTVRVEFPTAAADVIAAACATYEEADDFCRSGDMLTLAASPELRAFRRQLCEDIIAQLRA